ncbi:hypothetical protein F4703DRAFT_1248202 [Phycomyces blakesleeanus]
MYLPTIRERERDRKGRKDCRLISSLVHPGTHRNQFFIYLLIFTYCMGGVAALKDDCFFANPFSFSFSFLWCFIYIE